LNLSDFSYYDIYSLEVEILVASVSSTSSRFTIFFDTPTIRNIEFINGTNYVFIPGVTPPFPGKPIGTYIPGQKRQVRSVVNLAANQWEVFFDGNPVPAYSGSFGGATSITDIRFSTDLSGFGITAGIDNLYVAGDQLPVADAGATELLHVSQNGTNATVTLDGSLSWDPDGDPLEFTWFFDGQPLATGVVAAVSLPIGANLISLVVNDALAVDTNSIIVEVIPMGSSVVTTTTDEDDGTSDPALGTGTSLREAVNWVNLNPGPDTVTFDLGPGAHTITLTNGLVLYTDVEIQGPGADLLTMWRGSADAFTVFFVTPESEEVVPNIVTLSGMTIANGGSPLHGGGVWSYRAQMKISRCTFVGNHAESDGGAIDAYGAPLTVEDSTFVGNSGNEDGGAISVFDSLCTIRNSTFHENSAQRGGALYNAGSHPLIIENCTISGNSAAFFGGGLDVPGVNNVATINNSIVALNTATNFPDIRGSFTGGFNFIGQDHPGSDPLLGLLADNGGSTMTMALLPGSPCINAGDPAFVGPSDFDQRGPGYARVVDGRIDIGAFEIQDSDGDGVLDSIDRCPDTLPDAAIDPHGCSIAQLVPCNGPPSGGNWKNHGQYVQAVAHTTKGFLNAGLINRRQAAQIVRQATQSDCGKRR
jgi:hypothetical protein